MPDTDQADDVREMRMRIARHLADLHRLHLALAQDTRALKQFTTSGRAMIEIEAGADMLEQYLSATDAFLENMRGRFETRLASLRRNEPAMGLHAEKDANHGNFWLAFSRLCAVLKRAEGRIGRN